MECGSVEKCRSAGARGGTGQGPVFTAGGEGEERRRFFGEVCFGSVGVKPFER